MTELASQREGKEDNLALSLKKWPPQKSEREDEYSSDFEVSMTRTSHQQQRKGDEYSSDFEHTMSRGSFVPPKKRQQPTLDDVLFRLATDKALPVQIAELRILAAHQPKPGEMSENETLDRALDQLAIDLVAAQRRDRREAAELNAERRAQRERADERRRMHELRLESARTETRMALGRATTAESEAHDLRSRLADAERLLESARAARDSAGERVNALERDLESARADTASAQAAHHLDAARHRRQVAELEECATRRELQMEVVSAAQHALERRYDALLDRLPDVERRRVAAEDDRLAAERECLAAQRAALERERRLFDDRTVKTRSDLEKEAALQASRLEREAQFRSIALDKLVETEQASIRRAKEDAAATLAAAEAKLASAARDRAALDTATAKHAEDCLIWKLRVQALEPRFQDAEAAEVRAAKQLRAAEEAETRAKEILHSAKDAHFAAQSQAALLEEERFAVRNERRRADILAQRAVEDKERAAKRQVELERAEFSVKRQHVALARQLIASRRTADAATSHVTRPPLPHLTDARDMPQSEACNDCWPTIPPPTSSPAAFISCLDTNVASPRTRNGGNAGLPATSPKVGRGRIDAEPLPIELPPRRQSRFRAQIDALPEPGAFSAAARQIALTINASIDD